uniref:ShKT domain-containing protein n=1 Tax=Heterorhabditis bacteriophora TaxID=37862 RepID=A0A1I7XGS4_HETBA
MAFKRHVVISASQLLNEDSHQCFDRHSPDFCRKFLTKGDVWIKPQWSCNGQFANLAFRICRKTCNFCRSDIYRNPLGRFEPTPCGKQPELIPR